MAITLTGTAGCQFDITTTDTATSTGTKIVQFKTETAIRSVTYTDASKAVAFAGQVGTVGTTIDLYALADANDGTYYMRLQNNSATVALTSLLTLVVHNKAVSGTIKLNPGASNSALPASEQITIAAGAAAQLTFPSTAALTISATVRNFKLIGSAINMDCEVYILGA